MEPHDLVKSRVKFPFEFFLFQQQVVNELAPLARTGLYMDVGTGKTAVSTSMALYKMFTGEVKQAIILMPPILIPQWHMWLQSLGLSVLMYRGTPAKRKVMNLDADFILMSTQIFKNDFARLYKHLREREIFTIADEASSIRNTKTQNFKRVRDFTLGKQLTLLTGTAINTPMHCYGYIKLVAPTIYRSLKHFKEVHVAESDFFDQPTAYANLDILAENMLINAVRVRADDVLDLPEIFSSPVHYELSSKHMKLYKRLVEEKLLELEDGRVIDATTTTRLYHALQQMVMAPGDYADEDIRPAAFDLIDNTLEELEGSKLIIFNNYKRSNEVVTDYLASIGRNPVLCYGGGRSTPRKNEKNLERFLNDPSVTDLVASPRSVGVGLNLQSVSRYILFPELPLTSNDFKQAVGRVHRQGQDKTVFIKIGVALGTIQQRLLQKVVQKDDVVQEVMPDKQTMRKVLLGEGAPEN